MNFVTPSAATSSLLPFLDARVQRRSGNRPTGVGPIFATILSLLIVSPPAWSSCTPPASIKARLADHPTADEYGKLGTWFGDREQFACAAQAFAAAVKLQPRSASLTTMWGLSLYSSGDIQGAIGPLKLAVQLGASDVRPHLALAAALDQTGPTAAAEAEWRAALAIDPGSTEALDGLSRDLVADKEYAAVIALLEQPAYRPRLSPLQSVNLGMAYARTLQLNQAAGVLREGLKAAPDSLALADELSVVLMLLDQSDEANAILTDALTRHPADLNTKILYLRVLVSRKSDKADVLAQQLLLAAPHQWEVLYLNAELEMRAGQLTQARTHLEESITQRPDYPQTQTALGNVLARLDDFAGARVHLEKAIALGDSDPAVQYELAKVLQSLGEVDKARQRMELFQKLRNAESDKNAVVGKIDEADKAMIAGDGAEAATLYREALANDPDEARLHYKLAKALDKTGDLVEEKAELQRAIELNPNLAEAQNQMGYLATKSGDDAQAENYFRAAVLASPSYAVAWVNLAATLAGEDKLQDAKQALARALEIDPNNAQARRLDQVLAPQARP